MTTESLIEELSKQVHSLDWRGQNGACDEGLTIPDLWDKFVERGDAGWDFGNTLCHQGTLYPAVFLLVPSLIALAKSQHRHRKYALDILGECLMSEGGGIAYRNRLAAHDLVPNPFRPGESMTLGPPSSQKSVVREREQIREMRTTIEAEFDFWMSLAKSSDRDLRLAIMSILAGITNHCDQELAEQVVRRALEEAEDEEETKSLEWLCSHLDDEEEEDDEASLGL